MIRSADKNQLAAHAGSDHAIGEGNGVVAVACRGASMQKAGAFFGA